MEWWKTFGTATVLDRNHYQVWNGRRRLGLLRHSVGTTTKVWKTSRTATTLGWNHYPVWNGERRLRLLWHLVWTTTKYGLMENVRDCYDTRSEPLSNAVTGGRDCYGTWSRSSVGLRWLDSWSTKLWAGNKAGWYLILRQRRKAGRFQGECLCPITSTSPTKRNLVTIETSQWGDWMVEVEKINGRGISHSDR